MKRTIRSIIFLTYHFPPEVGGIQTRIANYCANLTKRGIRVSVIFPLRRARSPRNYVFNGADTLTCPGRLSYLPENCLEVLRMSVKNHADVMHVFTGASTLLGLYALVIGRFLKVPSTFSVFGREDFDLPSLVSRVCLLLSAEIATTISTNSHATKNLLPSKFHSKTEVLLGGAVSKLPNETSSDSDIAILFVGRLAKRKGVDDLLEAFAIVQKKIPSARLVIVGDGPERKSLETRSLILKLNGVEFKGPLFGENLENEYDNCCMCVLPSKSVPEDTANEGLGLTLVEAAMHAKPLVGTRHGGIPEVIKEEVNGILVPPGDPLALSNALIRLLCDSVLRKKMGEKAQEIANEQFTWEAATDRLLHSYDKGI